MNITTGAEHVTKLSCLDAQLKCYFEVKHRMCVKKESSFLHAVHIMHSKTVETCN